MKKTRALEESIEELSKILGRPVTKQEVAGKLSLHTRQYPELTRFYFPQEGK